jgi:hypothetical protein
MKVHSADRRSWLQIELQPDEENNYSSFVLAANVDCGRYWHFPALGRRPAVPLQA